MLTPRTAALAGLVLVGALLPVGLGLSAADAAAGCTSEAMSGGVPPTYCDDSTPPNTALEQMTPAPNAAGWTRSRTETFTFSAVVTDGDTGEMDFECKLDGPSQSHDWKSCTSPQQYTGLADTTGTPYTFQVRAYDASDRAIDPSTDPLFGVPDTNPQEEDTTPASISWQQDTQAPDGFLEGPYNPRGTIPVLKQPSTTATVGGSPDITSFRCQLDGVNVACGRGSVELANLAGGTRSLTLNVADAAGNVDASPTTVVFVVPYNLQHGRGWEPVAAQGAFHQDVLRATTKGATLKFKAVNVRAIDLVAPSGPGAQAFRVRVGTGFWHTIKPGKATTAVQHRFVVRDTKSPLFKGTVLVEALHRGATVDALVFPED